MLPQEARERIPHLTTITAGTYTFSLTSAFQRALDDNERVVATSRGNLPAQPQERAEELPSPTRGGRGRPPIQGPATRTIHRPLPPSPPEGVRGPPPIQGRAH